MYTTLLHTVISTVKSTLVQPNAYEEMDATMDMLFNPERYAEYRKRRAQRIDLGNKLILGATGLAVVGEVALAVRKSGVVGKILKR